MGLGIAVVTIFEAPLLEQPTAVRPITETISAVARGAQFRKSNLIADV
jgi:hypothetical protein